MTKSRLVLVLHLIGLEARGWHKFSRPIIERSKAKPMQSRITFDTHLKIALYRGLRCIEVRYIVFCCMVWGVNAFSMCLVACMFF